MVLYITLADLFWTILPTPNDRRFSLPPALFGSRTATSDAASGSPINTRQPAKGKKSALRTCQFVRLKDQQTPPPPESSRTKYCVCIEEMMIMSGKVSEKVEAVIKGLLLGYGGYRAVTDLYKLWYQWRNNQKKIGGENVVDVGNNEAAMLARRKPPEMWNTAIFFPDLQLGKEGSPTKQLIGLIENARISIQICVYLTSYVPLEEAILKKYSQGLIIQVVTCYDTMTAHNNHFKRWKDNLKIPVRMKCTRYLMHNKFVIIDDEAVITGSLNWTTQGIVGNQENVIVSTDPRHVAPYRKKFAELWNLYAE